MDGEIQVISPNVDLIPRRRLSLIGQPGHELHVRFCRGYVQGGSDGMPILGDFAVKYASKAQDLGVPTDDLYKALVDTAENTVGS